MTAACRVRPIRRTTAIRRITAQEGREVCSSQKMDIDVMRTNQCQSTTNCTHLPHMTDSFCVRLHIIALT